MFAPLRAMGALALHGGAFASPVWLYRVDFVLYPLLAFAAFLTSVLMKAPLAERAPFSFLLAKNHPFRAYLVSLGIALIAVLSLLPDDDARYVEQRARGAEPEASEGANSDSSEAKVSAAHHRVLHKGYGAKDRRRLNRLIEATGHGQ